LTLVLLYVYKKQGKQKASSGKLHSVQGTATRLPVKNRRRGTPRRTVPMRPPTKPLRGICHLTRGGRLQAPEGARPSHVVAAGPHQRAVGVHRRPPPHRRRRPAACLTRKPCSNCFSRPWLKCGSQRSTGKAASVHRRTRMAVLRRLRTLPNSCFCTQRRQRRINPFMAVSSSHRPLQTKQKWRNCRGFVRGKRKPTAAGKPLPPLMRTSTLDGVSGQSRCCGCNGVHRKAGSGREDHLLGDLNVCVVCVSLFCPVSIFCERWSSTSRARIVPLLPSPSSL